MSSDVSMDVSMDVSPDASPNVSMDVSHRRLGLSDASPAMSSDVSSAASDASALLSPVILAAQSIRAGVGSGIVSGGAMSDEERDRDLEALGLLWHQLRDQIQAGVLPTTLPDAVTKFEPGTLRGAKQLRQICETHLAQVR
jgi:hypothetical protein